MKKIFVLACYHLGLWGVLGFFATLLLGFLTCCANIPVTFFYISLGIFALVGITVSARCIRRDYKNTHI